MSYAPQAALSGHHTIRIETSYESAWRVTPETLRKACENVPDNALPTLMILNYPGNPDGLSYTESELQELVSIMREYKILVIADEIYGLLNHDGNYVSLATHYEYTIITTGLSKWCGAGGWRLGLAMLSSALDEQIKDAMLGVASETYSCAATPTQYAACTAYTLTDDIKDYLRYQQRLFKLLGGWCQQTLQEAGVRVHTPHGGFYLFIDFMPFADQLYAHGIKSAEQLCTDILRKTGVAVLPGDAFGMPEAHLGARLAYVDFNGHDVMLALQHKADIDVEFINEHCAHLVEGIQKLAAYTKAIM